MTNSGGPNSGLFVELHVPDFDKAKEFYCAFGFEVVWERTPEDDKGYLVLNLDGQLLTFWPGTRSWESQTYFSRFPSDTKRGFGVEIVIRVRDLESAYGIAIDRKCVVRDLIQRPWGVKDFRVEDPFGYYLRVTEAYDVRDSLYSVP